MAVTTYHDRNVKRCLPFKISRIRLGPMPQQCTDKARIDWSVLVGVSVGDGVGGCMGDGMGSGVGDNLITSNRHQARVMAVCGP